jgi:hypothetical protein
MAKKRLNLFAHLFTIYALEPTLEDFKTTFEASALSNSSKTANNHCTVTLPMDIERITPLLLLKTHKTKTPSSIANSNDFDSAKNQLERPIAAHQNEKQN